MRVVEIQREGQEWKVLDYRTRAVIGEFKHPHDAALAAIRATGE